MPRMAITASAKKAHRQSLKKHVFNVRRVRAMKSGIKDFSHVTTKAEAEKMLPEVYSAIDKAVKRGVLKANTGSRRKAAAAKKAASLV